jgi:molecular chaperone GrpE
MTDASWGGRDVRTDAGGRPDPEEGEASGPIVRDKRRLDPETGTVRAAYAAHEPGAAGPRHGAAPEEPAEGRTEVTEDTAVTEALAAAEALAEQRGADLQRLEAEYYNYRRRVERDRAVARDSAVAGVLEALLPVLDDVHLARQHGDLEVGPFAAIAEKLETVLSRFGLERYGEPGEVFDPTVHEALAHTEAELAEGTTDTTVVQVFQPGYRVGDRVVRAARVGVADPS